MPSTTVSGSAAQILPENLARRSVFFENEDSTQVIFLKFEKAPNTTVSTTDHDMRLGPTSGKGLVLGEDGPDKVFSRVTAIADGGTPRLAIFESEGIPIPRTFEK